MDFLYDLLVILFFILIVIVITLRLRKRLLVIWKEVSIKEIIFHRLLSETIKLFYTKKELLKSEENRLAFIHLGRSRKKKMRYLLLQERQDLFQHIQDLFTEMEELNDEELIPLKKQYKALQKARRIYNSRVLLYNQTIHIFPTRHLAIKMNLKTKEYFG